MKKIRKAIWNWILGLTTVDEKIVSVVAETKRRAKLVGKEVADVKKAVKEVGNQVGDIGGAIKGKTRKGRKTK